MSKFLSFLVNNFYKMSPVWMQNFGISIFGFFWHRRRFGGNYKNELHGFINREKFSKNDWLNYQTFELRLLLKNAYENVPFYRTKFDQLNLSLNDLGKIDMETLHNLPFLEKNELRTFGTTSMLSLKIEKNGQFFHSSGSTGTPTKIYFSRKMHQKWSAGFEVRIRNWAGLSKNNSRGTIGGRRVVQNGTTKGPFYRYNFIERQVYFSAYHISFSNVNDYLKGITKYKLDYMTGYAMSNYFLARFIEESKVNPPKLKAVITSSEKLTQEMRQTFERVYGCKTYDSYSGVEACGLISECEYGSLHISPDMGIIEVIKEDGTIANFGEIGEAVCTGLLNFDQPLIRYRIGDLIKLSHNQICDCGRQMPIVEEIIGRIEDTVIGKDGREMVRFHGIFVGISKIVEGQIVQQDLEDFEINLVVSKELDAKEIDTINSRMFSQLGIVNIKINFVKEIPRNSNGKFKSVISKIKRVNEISNNNRS